jgi:hypothetical protein
MREERAINGAVRPALSEVPALIEHHVGLDVAVQLRGPGRMVAVVPASAPYPGALTVAVRALRAMGFRAEANRTSGTAGFGPWEVAVTQAGPRVAAPPAPGAGLPVEQRALRAYLGVAGRIALPRAATALRRAADALVDKGLAVLEGATAQSRAYRIAPGQALEPGGEGKPVHRRPSRVKATTGAGAGPGGAA